MYTLSKKYFPKTLQIALMLSVTVGFAQIPGWGDDTININTGSATDSILGNNNQQANDTGIAVNGNVNDANLNNNQNSNTNVLQPIVVSQPNYSAAGRGGGGGNSALILPRNPLPLPNAVLGRSNFGMQVGVQNNPGISTLTNGRENGMGWFMQAGLTIPFGKIPSVYDNTRNAQLDTLRQDRLDAQRRVFAGVTPGNQRQSNVQGKVVGLNAYNYSVVPSGRIPVQNNSSVGEIVLPQPRVLALKPADAFSQPMNTGEQIGLVEVGKEYPYLGHTRSGWVKLLLPNGKEAWTTAQFEYLKFDYTEIDTLASDSGVMNQAKSAANTKENNLKKRRG